VLVEHGVRSYSIYLDPQTSELFAYAEIESEDGGGHRGDARLPALVAAHARADAVEPDGSPVASDLREIFHIERTR